MERLTVELGARSYDILIGDGLLADIGAQVAPLLNRRRTMIVTDAHVAGPYLDRVSARSEEHTSELQSLMRISYAVFCLKQKQPQIPPHTKPYINIHNTPTPTN